MLIPVQQEIEQFVSAIFRYAEEGTFVSLRAFDQKDRGKPPVLIQGIEVKGDMAAVVIAATKAAERAANSIEPSVFAPPVATFNNPRTARSADVACGVALTVEMDQGDPNRAKAKLEALLGPVTVAVASGGEWLDPKTGELHNKMHLHWRLSEPTLQQAEHEQLQEARRLAALYVGGDPTAAPPAHPLRWPGSWNRKSTPRLAMIAAGNPAAEIHLADALAKLEEAVEAAGLEYGQKSGPKVSSEPQTSVHMLKSALAALPNVDAHWDQWVRVGMAIYRATGGSADGLDAWTAWSSKSGKHTDAACEERWAHFASSPPSRIGAGTIYFMAKAEGWRRVEDEGPRDGHLSDPGYLASLEADLAMTPEEWDEIALRESGQTIPSKPTTGAGKQLLWCIQDAWEERDIPERPWITRGYLMRGAVTVVSGPGSAGKSSLMVAWAAVLTIGCAFGRFKIASQMRVAIYNVEDDADEQRRRFSAMAAHLGHHPKSFEGRLAILGPENVGTLLHTPRDGSRMLNTPVMDRLLSFIEEFKPDVLILDPFVELHAAEENDNTAVRAVMAAFRAVAAEKNIAVVILHHARKGLLIPGDPDSLRGASSIVGAARVALTLNVMSEDEAKMFNIGPDMRRDYFRLDGAKSNYAPISEAEWFKRHERRLANGDHVAVAWPWQPPNLLKQAPIADVQRVLEQIDAGPADGVLYAATKRGKGNERWVGKVIADMLGGSEEQAREIVAKWLRTGLLYEEEYEDPRNRHAQKGVRVDFSKRPDAAPSSGIAA